MSEVRFFISLDEAHASRIGAAAARTGQDVSAFMGAAALDAVDDAMPKNDVRVVHV